MCSQEPEGHLSSLIQTGSVGHMGSVGGKEGRGVTGEVNGGGGVLSERG